MLVRRIRLSSACPGSNADGYYKLYILPPHMGVQRPRFSTLQWYKTASHTTHFSYLSDFFTPPKKLFRPYAR